MSTHLKVLSVGPAVTVQDMGRTGRLGQGVGQGGAADKLALMEGAALLGQNEKLAALEMAGMGGRFQAGADLRIALTGAPMMADVDGQTLLWNAVHALKAGQILQIGGVRAGVYGYLHVGGGFETEQILGARSTHLLAGLGRAVQAGDHMRVGHDTGTDVGVGLDVPDRTKGGVFHVVDTPQTELFSAETQARFFETVFRRDARANRMGVRVNWEDGQGFSAAGQLSLVSDFALPGDIQMTGDGEPAVLLVEAQTTAGYPRIGTVLPCDLPRVAQAALGAQMRFKQVSRTEALEIQRRSDAADEKLRSKVKPIYRDPKDIPDLLSYQLIDGVVSARPQPKEQK